MNGRKGLSLVLSGAMMASMLSLPAMAAERTAPAFPDAEGSWASESIDRWGAAGVVNGDDKGNFNPTASITRAELAQIFVNMFGLTEKAPNTYADLRGDEWYADAILKCTAAGIMEGDGVSARPLAMISRQETMVMFGRAMGVTPDETPDLSGFTDGASVADWAAGYMAPLAEMGIISGSGDGSIQPAVNIDRASTMALLDKAITVYINEPGEYSVDNQKGFVVVNAAGEVKLTGKSAGVVVTAGSSGTVKLSGLTADTVKVDGTASVTLENGTAVDTVSVNSAAAVTVSSGVKVETMAVNADADVSNAGTITTLEANSAADVKNTGTIRTLDAAAAVRVDNSGTISKAEINADGVILDGRRPSKIDVADGVKNPTDSKGNEIKDNTGSGGGGYYPPSVTDVTLTQVSKPVASGNFTNKENINKMLDALWTPGTHVVDGITVEQVFSAAGNTLIVDKDNVTEGLLTWIATQWGGSSVPVALTLEQTDGIPTDGNWSNAILAWVDLKNVQEGALSISLGNNYATSLNIDIATPTTITSVEKPNLTGDFENKANVNEMLTALWTDGEQEVQGIMVSRVFSYDNSANTLTINKANVTDSVLTWITTQWGGTSVPVKVTLKDSSIEGDPNWDGATLAWIDLKNVESGIMNVQFGEDHAAALKVEVANTSTVSTEEALRSALEKYDVVTVSENISLTSELVIPAGKTVKIAEDKKLTGTVKVSAGGTLAVVDDGETQTMVGKDGLNVTAGAVEVVFGESTKITIPEGTTAETKGTFMDLGDGSDAYRIPKSDEMIVNGTLDINFKTEVAGKLTVNGTLHANEELLMVRLKSGAQAGALTIGEAASVTGTVKVAQDGKLVVMDDEVSHNMIGAEGLNVTAGAVEVVFGENTKIIIPEGTTAETKGTFMDLGDGSDAYRIPKNDEMIVNGTLNIDFNVEVTGKLTINEGGKVTVKADKALEVLEVKSGETAGSITAAVGTLVGENEKAKLVLAKDKMYGDMKAGTYIWSEDAWKADVATVLQWALAYQYDPAYEYTNKPVIEGTTVTYTGTQADFTEGADPGDENPTRATADLARLLGAMWRIDEGKSVSTITYNDKAYTWNAELGLKGSNWANGGSTLVTDVANAAKTGLSDGSESFSFTVNGETVTLVLKVSG